MTQDEIQDVLNRKSVGHIAFWRDWEFFEFRGEVYRAKRADPLTNHRHGKQAARHGRWECSRKHFDHFRSVIMPD